MPTMRSEAPAAVCRITVSPTSVPVVAARLSWMTVTGAPAAASCGAVPTPDGDVWLEQRLLRQAPRRRVFAIELHVVEEDGLDGGHSWRRSRHAFGARVELLATEVLSITSNFMSSHTAPVVRVTPATRESTASSVPTASAIWTTVAQGASRTARHAADADLCGARQKAEPAERTLEPA